MKSNLSPWIGNEIQNPSKAHGAAFFPLNWKPSIFAEERFGFEKLYVPRIFVCEKLKPDFDALRLSPKKSDDQRPRNTNLRFWNPNVMPLNVFDTLTPWVVLKLKPLSGCQERDGFGSVVRASLNLNFEDINGQLISIRLKKGRLYFFITTFQNQLNSREHLTENTSIIPSWLI